MHSTLTKSDIYMPNAPPDRPASRTLNSTPALRTARRAHPGAAPRTLHSEPALRTARRSRPGPARHPAPCTPNPLSELPRVIGSGGWAFARPSGSLTTNAPPEPASEQRPSASSSSQKRSSDNSDVQEAVEYKFKRIRKLEVETENKTLTFWDGNTIYIAERY